MAFLTYGDLTPAQIERAVSSPSFPAWCEKMQKRQDEALAAIFAAADAAIEENAAAVHRKAVEAHRAIDMQLMLATGDDLDAMKERKLQCR